MTTILVWVLVFHMTGFREPALVSVDNISSKAECERVGERLKWSFSYHAAYSCTQVRKVQL